MRTISEQDLKDILEKHGKFLRNEEGGERADLSSADLRSANLRYANLRSANLSYADLRSANLSSANLSYADLRSANLSSANLRYADLRSANLSSANLRYANLRYADLRSADLSSADLRYADLSSADLRSADLRSADLVVFQYQRHWAYFTFDGFLRIGCHHLPISEWFLGYKELGKAEGYTEDQILMYGNFIKSCVELFDLKNKEKP
jgi:hypothetical protein